MPTRRFVVPRQIAALAIVLALAALPVARGAAEPLTFLVGADDCDFTAIQPAINAAASNPGPDFIRVATNRTYTAQALRMNAQDVEIIGGFASCASAVPTPGATTTISGAGGAADSVLVILGNGQRTLRNLTITGGDETDSGTGGGIDYDGFGELVLENVVVRQNRAGFGAGISFNAPPARGTLTLAGNVIVENNVAAGSGGGIRLSGSSRLVMLGVNTTVRANEALGLAGDTGYGGGIQVVPPAVAEIGSPGLADIGAVAFNEAKYGGGIAMTAREDGDESSFTLLYSTDPQHPVRVHDNVASIAGGGYYGSINYGFVELESTTLCAYEFRIDHNRAPDGAAIFLGHDEVVGTGVGARAVMNRVDGFACSVFSLPPAPLARSCDPGVPCNRVDSNEVRQASGQPADGAVVAMDRSATLVARRVAWVDNAGTDLIRARAEPDDDPFHVAVEECLMADNTLTARLIATDTAHIAGCTLAGNTVGLSTLLLTDVADISDSIIWQPGFIALAGAPEVLTGAHVITNDPGSLPLGPTVANREPRFIDRARGDYRLRAGSPAVDYAPPVVGDDRDLDGLPHDRDLPVAVDEFGVRDVGAYERQALLPLELNGTFDVDLNQWSVVTAGITRFDPAENATGQFPGGSMEVDWVNSPVVVSRVTGRVQCIHLPGPGGYRLNGRARTTGSLPPIVVQTATLAWEFRRDGTESCTTGVPDRQGDFAITSGSNWVLPAQAASIDVSAGEWTPNSSIAIYTVVKSSGTTFPPNLHAWFDGIALTVDGGPALFKDGFE